MVEVVLLSRKGIIYGLVNIDPRFPHVVPSLVVVSVMVSLCVVVVQLYVFLGGGPEADRLLPPDGQAVPDQLCDGEPPRHTSIQP